MAEAKIHLPNTPAMIKGKSSVCYMCMYFAHKHPQYFADAASTYYTSVSGSKRLRDSGKYSSKLVQQRRRNRVMRVSLCGTSKY